MSSQTTISVPHGSELNIPIEENVNTSEPGCSSWEQKGESNIELVQDNPPVDISHLNKITGRRIVDINYLFNQISEIGYHEPFHCSIADMEIDGEQRIGINSKIFLKCKMCNITKTILTDRPEVEKEILDVNKSVVLATLSTGNGYSQMSEIMATLNIPCMAQNTFSRCMEEISTAIHDTAWKVMEEAGVEEAALAKEVGDFKNGYPAITVIADGAWCKRSYGVNYNASSGVGCIVGQRTKKLLFLGVRNKYCSVCARAESMKKLPSEHICYKNWNKPSTAMETDIIVEGFKNSIELHGLIYSQLVGDGDSSVYKKLLETKPYGNNMLIKKVECRNHLIRNYVSKLRDLVKHRVSSKQKIVSPKLRFLLKNKIEKLRVSIVSAVKYRNKESTIFSQKIEDLKKDLLNSIDHVFGSHDNCARYFCCGTKENEVNSVPELKECGLYDDILACVYRLVHHSSSLLMNMDNNSAENYNTVVAKFTGGKRINFALRGSYQTRCEAATISYNMRGDYHRRIHKALTNRSPGKYTKQYSKIKKRNLEYVRRRSLNFSTKRKKENIPSDEHYGQESAAPDISDQDLSTKKELLLKSLQKNETEIAQLEENTRGQSSNHLWKEERYKRLTASSFGKICKMRKTTSCVSTVKSLLYSEFEGTKATKYGIEHEQFAIRQFEADIKKTVKTCGLFVDIKYGFLGASPDGLVDDDGIIEIKCPAVAAKLTPIEAILNKKVNFVDFTNNEIKLKQNHNYMYQIQGQLHITRKRVCYFVLWTPLGMSVEKIYRDDSFWTENMEKKLTNFYNTCLLPELIDSRHLRKLPIRDPPRD